MKRLILINAILLAMILAVPSAFAQASKSDAVALRSEIGPYVKEVMKRLPTSPGIAIAVVRGDEVIFAGGFGYRDVAKKLPVDTHTKFYIASTTKSFTATASKILAERGSIDLDAPIKKYFPELVLPAPVSTEQLSMRDLLTHRSGLSNDPIAIRTAYIGGVDNKEILRLLARYSEVRSPEYAYTNLGYVIAGIAIENATGKSWKTVLKEELFGPLDLGDTTTSVSEAIASGDYASPYTSEDGEISGLPLKQDDTMHAAGGIFSSADDLALWLVVNINLGRLNGNQVIPKRVMEEVLSPQVDQHRSFYEYKRYAYSLGWNIADWNGEKFVHCFGTYGGSRPHVSFLPERGLGVVVLVNESDESLFLPDVIANDIYDRMIKGRAFSTDAGSRTEKLAAELDKERERRRLRDSKQDAKMGVEPAGFPLARFAGSFSNDGFGHAEIRYNEKEGALEMILGNLSSKLSHVSGNTFRADFRLLSPMDVTFANGSPDSFTVVGTRFVRN